MPSWEQGSALGTMEQQSGTIPSTTIYSVRVSRLRSVKIDVVERMLRDSSGPPKGKEVLKPLSR